MSRHPQHVVTTVSLPSGRTLEVIRPERGNPFTRVRIDHAEDRDLCLCEACGSDLVAPVAWHAAGPERWQVDLRCPNCEARSAGVFSQECVDRFDDRLDMGVAAIVADLKRLEHANMADHVEQFIAALEVGAILPEDF